MFFSGCESRAFWAKSLCFVSLTSLSLMAAPVQASGQQLSISGYHLQSSARTSLYEYDYTYTADLTDSGVTAERVIATVTSSTPSTVVISDALSFVGVSSGNTYTSSGTITIRQDRRVPFTPSSLNWTFQAQGSTLAPGTVTSTNNPQVALYTIMLPSAGSVTIHFGPDTNYGHQTWTQSTVVAGPVSILVAGMLASSTYHMQASVQLANGLSTTDVDHSFTTGSLQNIPSLTAETTAGMTPQRGIEQLTMVTGPLLGVVATDLQARVLWAYTPPNSNGSSIEGAKLLDNGHFLLSIGNGSSYPLTGVPHGLIAIREIDLAGNVIRDVTAAQVTSELQARGYDLDLLEFHHDITALPNGHLLVLSNVLRSFTDLPGYPGVTRVLGDVIVDLDPNMHPVWVWNSFDHLDVNRHPFLFPDWTHSNAVVYSHTDGNIVISMRHQNWVLKVNYQNGAGDGSILWHLGEGGDFALQGGTTPTDWQYAQHFPNFFSENTAGVFSLGLMDNGNDRDFPTGTTCGSPGAPACQYTTIPVYQIDEAAKTATLVFHQILPTSLFSYFGGNTDRLANGNVEYDLAGTSTATSDIFEVTPTSHPETVWHLHTSAALAYRGYRIPSLYPGVEY